MSWSALETIPSLSGKTREIRVLFADVANTALLKGRTTDEAIFQGLAAVKSKEKQSIVKQLRPSIPSHLKAILSVRDNPPELQIEKSTEGSQTSVDAIKSLEFDSKGRLIMKFDNGKKLVSNIAPITVSEHSVIVIGDGGVQGASPSVVEGLKQLTYAGEDLSRVDMPDGSYKLLTYVDTVLTQVDHVQATQTVRQTLYYTTGVLTSVNTEII